jgi:tetratricopeptide (TPR) repeat protein
VVHPGQLSRERLIEVCTQCHSNAYKRRTAPLSYRPGQPLEAHFRTAPSKHPEDDHVANQIKYLRQSKCFQKSDLTCVTCHDPHRPPAPAQAQQACLQCHQPAHCKDRANLPAGVRDRCAACHMPARVWMNVHFHTEQDQYVPPIRRFSHTIAVHPEARQEVLLAWYRTQPDPHSRRESERLTRALVEYWLAEADKRRREHRFLAAIGALREALHVDPAPATRQVLRAAVATQARLDRDLADGLYLVAQRRQPEAREALQRVLAVKPDHAVAHGRLGMLDAEAGKKESAVEHLRAVARHDPNSDYGYSMLGWMAYLDGNFEEASAAYRKADAIEPYDAKINYHWALALARLQRWAEAADHFRQVLRIDPRHTGACQGLAHVLGRQGQPAQAVRFARRAARLTRYQDASVLLTLAESYSAAGRRADAEKVGRQALDLAQRSNPNLVPTIHTRLAEIRARP